MRFFVNICFIKPYDKTRVFGGDCGKPANLLGGNIRLFLIDCIKHTIMTSFCNAMRAQIRTHVMMS